MPSRFRAWKTLPPDHKDYIFIYAWGALWAVSYFLFAPPITGIVLDRSIVLLWVVAAVAGALLAIAGLLLRDTLLIERLGVTLLMVAPIVYSVTQFGLFIALLVDPALLSPGSTAQSRIYLFILGFWSFWWLNKRRRQIKKQVAEAKAAPLKSEETE